MKYAKRYMAKIGSAGILLTALAATACMDHGDDIPLIELGAVENSFTVNATAGPVATPVHSLVETYRSTPTSRPCCRSSTTGPRGPT